MIFLLRDSGLINRALMDAGLIQVPLRLLYTEGAVLAGLVYGALPFMILPIYASIEKLDPALLENRGGPGRALLVPLHAGWCGRSRRREWPPGPCWSSCHHSAPSWCPTFSVARGR